MRARHVKIKPFESCSGVEFDRSCTVSYPAPARAESVGAGSDKVERGLSDIVAK